MLDSCFHGLLEHNEDLLSTRFIRIFFYQIRKGYNLITTGNYTDTLVDRNGTLVMEMFKNGYFTYKHVKIGEN